MLSKDDFINDEINFEQFKEKPFIEYSPIAFSLPLQTSGGSDYFVDVFYLGYGFFFEDMLLILPSHSYILSRRIYPIPLIPIVAEPFMGIVYTKAALSGYPASLFKMSSILNSLPPSNNLFKATEMRKILMGVFVLSMNLLL